LFEGPVPPFAKLYANLADEVARAAREYADEVRTGRYPLAPAPATAGASTK
jgi:ketopantoate hydroxymethyltransferase